MSKIYDKTAANFKATTIDAKVIDAQKILVRPKNGSIDDRINIIDVVEASLMGNLSGFNTNYTTNTGETEGVSIQLDKADFMPSGVYLKELTLPYKQALTNEARYCHILVYNDAEEQIIKITSTDTQRRQTGYSDLLESTWHYNNILIPDYAFVRIVLSSSATLPITGTNNVNCSKFRINVTRNTSNQNIIPTNRSKLYNANGGTQAYLGWVKVVYAEHILGNINSIKDKVSDIEKDINTITQYNNENYYTEYETSVFQFGLENVAGVYTSSVRFGCKHMPKGVITKVSFYGRDADSATHASKTTGCYLLANVYNKTTGSLIRSHVSTNKVVVLEKQSGAATRPLNTWKFDGFNSINEGEIIKFIPSANGETQSANYYFGCLYDNTHTHEDCQIGGDGDFTNNPLAAGVKAVALGVFEGKFYYDYKENESPVYEKNFIKGLYTITTGKIFDNNIDNKTLGDGNVKGFVLERPYITNGVFNEVRWQSTGAASSEVRLRITLKDRRGKKIKSILSDNSQSFMTAGEKVYRFPEDFEVNDNIGSLVFESDSTGVSNTNGNQQGMLRVRVIGNEIKNDTDGSESINYNYLINVIFYGKVAETSDALLSAEEKAALQQLVQGSIAVREITIIDDDANAVSLLSENYEEIEDEGIVLKFEDSLDNNYLMCSEKDLVDATDYLELDVNINCPEKLGKKLVRRYLVIDLRNMEDERNIVTIFPENVKWSSQIPVIQANKFYVISFQRFAKDLVVANVELYLAD